MQLASILVSILSDHKPGSTRPSRQLIYSDMHSVLRRPLKNETRLPAQSVLLIDKDKVHSVTKRGRKIDIVQVEFENDATVLCFPDTILIKGNTFLKGKDGRKGYKSIVPPSKLKS